MRKECVVPWVGALGVGEGVAAAGARVAGAGAAPEAVGSGGDGAGSGWGAGASATSACLTAVCMQGWAGLSVGGAGSAASVTHTHAVGCVMSVMSDCRHVRQQVERVAP
jgi:hypothetical protein